MGNPAALKRGSKKVMATDIKVRNYVPSKTSNTIAKPEPNACSPKFKIDVKHGKSYHTLGPWIWAHGALTNICRKALGRLAHSTWLQWGWCGGYQPFTGIEDMVVSTQDYKHPLAYTEIMPCQYQAPQSKRDIKQIPSALCECKYVSTSYGQVVLACIWKSSFLGPHDCNHALVISPRRCHPTEAIPTSFE